MRRDFLNQPDVDQFRFGVRPNLQLGTSQRSSQQQDKRPTARRYCRVLSLLNTVILTIMPTYDYRCERTGEMFEFRQSFSDPAIATCPLTHDNETETCGAEVKKVFSKVGISFKGQGFYKNDHGSNAGNRSTTSESTPAPKAAESSTTSSTGSGSSGTSGATAD